MATVDELESRIEALQKRIETAEANIARWPARVARGTVTQEVADENIARNQADIQRFQAELAQLQTQLDVARTQEIATRQQGPATTSSGAVVTEAQVARDDAANTQLPEPPAQPAVNAETFAVNDDAGTDEPVRSINETQTVPPPTAASPIPVADTLPPPGSSASPEYFQNEAVATAPGEPGAGAVSDDGAVQDQGLATDDPASSNDVTVLANKTARAITPQPNILDKFASYTYSISIYLMSPEDYQRLMTNKQRYLAGYQLLIQSAGAPQLSGTVEQTAEAAEVIAQGGVSLSQGRNQYFPLDYYIDDVELKSVVAGKGTGSPHNAVELKFRLIEPNGITLLDNLYKATRQYIDQGGGASSSTQNGNYAAQNYLMVIRFYGYDQNGNPVTTTTQDPAGRSDNRAIVEKFIPFQFTGIKFRIANKLTEYECSAVCPQNVIGTGQGRGTIPYNIELTATTLQNLFNGNITYQQPPGAVGREGAENSTAPEKANAAPNPTITTGLVPALNKYQEELVNNGTYSKADKYKVVISHPELANASVVPPGETNRKATPMTNAQTAGQAKDSEKQSVNSNAKTVSATAGMSIVQFIDMAVRSSDYIYKQQTKIVDKDGKEIPQAGAAQAFAWYKIGVEAKPLENDPKRNDNAYEITYEIAPYGINDIKSEYFPKGRFRGAQKKYAYWFTGENTSVLNYEQDFNYLYYITVNSRQAPPAPRGTANYREVEKKLFSPNSPQSNQGIEGNINEPAANAADYLYSPADQGRVRLTIVGDPAWIAQGEVWSGIRATKRVGSGDADVYFDAFLADGTINFDAREALFELSWNKPADYNIQTGLMEIKGSQENTQTYVYKAVTVMSNFRQGRFTQELEGVLLVFPETITSKQAEQSATGEVKAEDQSAAETARLQRQNDAAADGRAALPISTGTPASSGLSTAMRSFGQNQASVVRQPSVSLSSIFGGESAGQLLQPALNSLPTSSGLTIGVDSPYRSGAVNIGEVSASLLLKTGDVQTVYTSGEVTSLYNQGLADFRSANAALVELASKTAAQQPQADPAAPQRILRDD